MREAGVQSKSCSHIGRSRESLGLRGCVTNSAVTEAFLSFECRVEPELGLAR